MPELPEVEVVRAGLARHVAGRTVTRVEILDPLLEANTRRPPPAAHPPSRPIPPERGARLRGHSQ